MKVLTDWLRLRLTGVLGKWDVCDVCLDEMRDRMRTSLSGDSRSLWQRLSDWEWDPTVAVLSRQMCEARPVLGGKSVDHLHHYNCTLLPCDWHERKLLMDHVMRWLNIFIFQYFPFIFVDTLALTTPNLTSAAQDERWVLKINCWQGGERGEGRWWWWPMRKILNAATHPPPPLNLSTLPATDNLTTRSEPVRLLNLKISN